MHALDFDSASFDHVFLMHALTYSRTPDSVLAEAARLLRPGGRLVLATLAAHTHNATIELYDHVNLGFSADDVRSLIADAGLQLTECHQGAREPRPPYFEVIAAVAHKPR